MIYFLYFGIADFNLHAFGTSVIYRALCFYKFYPLETATQSKVCYSESAALRRFFHLS